MSVPGSRFNKKLQSIFSAGVKLSADHFLLFMKSFSAVCKVRKVFLSTLDPILLLITFTLALSSCALQYCSINTKQIKLIVLLIFILYDRVYDIPCNFIFWLAFKIVFFTTIIKNSYFVSVYLKARCLII